MAEFSGITCLAILLPMALYSNSISGLFELSVRFKYTTSLDTCQRISSVSSWQNSACLLIDYIQTKAILYYSSGIASLIPKGELTFQKFKRFFT